MYYIATTRFNNDTFKQNRDYCINKSNLYYGTPIPMKDKIKKDYFVFVLEMNNDENKIMGLGIIKNTIINQSKNHLIYKDRNYNRFIYKGYSRIDRSQIKDEYSIKVFEILDLLLFKGSRHIKRAQGITELPDWIDNKKFNFSKYFRFLFRKYNNYNVKYN
jgi:hypothetical protein